MEYLIENDKDIIFETLASFEERQAGNAYRKDVRENFYKGYFLGVDYLVIKTILQNSEWRHAKFLDVMCGEGYRTCRLFSEMEEIELLERRDFKRIMKTMYQVGNKKTQSIFEGRKDKYDIHGIDGSEVMLKYAAASGTFRNLTHSVLPCKRLGIDTKIKEFNYCFILGGSIGHICGKDGNDLRLNLLKEARKLILQDGKLLIDFCYYNWTLLKGVKENKLKNVYRKKCTDTQKNYTYVRIFDCGEFKNLVEQSGFEVCWLKGVILEFNDQNRPKVRIVDIYNSFNNIFDPSVLSNFPFAMIVSLCVPRETNVW